MSEPLAESLHREAVGDPHARLPEGGVHRRTVRLTVDGRAVPFECLSAGTFWLMYAELDGMELVLRGRNFKPDAVELVRLSDAGAYLANFLP